MVSKKMFLPRAVSVPSTWADKVNAKAHLQAEGGSENSIFGRVCRPAADGRIIHKNVPQWIIYNEGPDWLLHWFPFSFAVQRCCLGWLAHRMEVLGLGAWVGGLGRLGWLGSTHLGVC